MTPGGHCGGPVRRTLVADQPWEKAAEDRRQGWEPRPLRQLRNRHGKIEWHAATLFFRTFVYATVLPMARPLHLDRLTGRPSRYSLDAATEILFRMSNGEALYKICQDEHLPHESTVRKWADSGKYPEFERAYARARYQGYRWFEEAVAIADESKNAATIPELGSYQLRVRARQWAAARLVPEFRAPHDY
jgi:hypothetical protein